MLAKFDRLHVIDPSTPSASEQTPPSKLNSCPPSSYSGAGAAWATSSSDESSDAIDEGLVVIRGALS